MGRKGTSPPRALRVGGKSRGRPRQDPFPHFPTTMSELSAGSREGAARHSRLPISASGAHRLGCSAEALHAWAALTGASSQPPSTPWRQILQALRVCAIFVCPGRWDGTAESLFRSRAAFSPVGPVSPPWSPALAIPGGCWIYQGLARAPPSFLPAPQSHPGACGLPGESVHHTELTSHFPPIPQLVGGSRLPPPFPTFGNC